MSGLTADEIQKRIKIEPAIWTKERVKVDGFDLSYGLCEASYDIRLSHNHHSSIAALPRLVQKLAVSLEKVFIPTDVIAHVYNKSTLVRLGLWQPTTTLEPGWYGHITLELMYVGHQDHFQLHPGMPIAQVVFNELNGHTRGYKGRYQDQPEVPVRAI